LDFQCWEDVVFESLVICLWRRSNIGQDKVLHRYGGNENAGFIIIFTYWFCGAFIDKREILV